jgi:hypothetical protein
VLEDFGCVRAGLAMTKSVARGDSLESPSPALSAVIH